MCYEMCVDTNYIHLSMDSNIIINICTLNKHLIILDWRLYKDTKSYVCFGKDGMASFIENEDMEEHYNKH